MRTLRQWNSNLIHQLKESSAEPFYEGVCGIRIPRDDQWVEVSEETDEPFGRALGRYCSVCRRAAQEERERQEQERTYRHRLVVIEALQYDGTVASRRSIEAQWPGEGVDGTSIFRGEPEDDSPRGPMHGHTLWLTTREGARGVYPGWWVIRGLPEDFWTKSPQAFEATYEPYRREPA